VIAEACEVDAGLREMIEKKETLATCTEYARKRGFRPMHEDGTEKVDWGVTTREEVLRVLYT
jgi:type II secretory ATPase GspE/PulE/Tfp pilus assembly ATPase PilB-like protein